MPDFPLTDLIRFACEQLALDVYGVAWNVAEWLGR